MKSRAWCFTINNPTETLEIGNKLTELNLRYVVYQKEKGKEDTEHYQGYLYFTNPRTLNGLKAIKGLERSHLEPARGSPTQNRDYCTKSDTRLDGPWEFGEIPSQGERTDLKLIMQTILDDPKMSREEYVIANPFHEYKYKRILDRAFQIRDRRLQEERRKQWNRPEVYIYWGSPGSGKTKKCYDICDSKGWRLEKVALGDGSKGSIWFDGTEDADAILLDDFEGYHSMRHVLLMGLLDYYPIRLQIKGGTITPCWKAIFITSNLDPEQWYKYNPFEALKRRTTEIIKMGEGELSRPEPSRFEEFLY